MENDRINYRRNGVKQLTNNSVHVHHIMILNSVIEWCFTPLLTVFQSYHGNSSHYSCLSWVSPVLGWGPEVSCSMTLPRKNPEDPVRLEPRNPI